ncbi:MAG: protein phosphatase 2C domain-containing protein [Thermodesulfobacteriota bacterium]|nr:protein phosphatase 2C domain-containing protein [Thermodesulfobacteriota bacterium]
MIISESAGITDIGKKRKINEDSMFLDDKLGLYLIADGMGGHRAGEVASNMVVETISSYIKKLGEDDDTQEFSTPDQTLSSEANHLISAIRLSNRIVYQVSNGNEGYRGMGSTLSAVYFNKDTFIAANVGDSPIYLIHNGDIELISVPHTVIAEVGTQNLEGPRPLGPEFYNMLTRAVGTDETVKPDICEIPYFKDDIIVICSDGLSGNVTPNEMLDAALNKSSQTAGRYLLDLANERGGDDNISVIIIKIKRAYSSAKGIRRIIWRILEGYNNFLSKKRV